jgi:hypothetical protein
MFTISHPAADRSAGRTYNRARAGRFREPDVPATRDIIRAIAEEQPGIASVSRRWRI